MVSLMLRRKMLSARLSVPIMLSLILVFFNRMNTQHTSGNIESLSSRHGSGQKHLRLWMHSFPSIRTRLIVVFVAADVALRYKSSAFISLMCLV